MAVFAPARQKPPNLELRAAPLLASSQISRDVMTYSDPDVRPAARLLNPHFDQRRFIWKDAYSAEYQPARYSDQFDDQWRYFLEKRTGFHNHTGVETADSYIDDRILRADRGRRVPLEKAIRATLRGGVLVAAQGGSARAARYRRQALSGAEISDRPFPRQTLPRSRLRPRPVDANTPGARRVGEIDRCLTPCVAVDLALQQGCRRAGLVRYLAKPARPARGI